MKRSKKQMACPLCKEALPHEHVSELMLKNGWEISSDALDLPMDDALRKSIVSALVNDMPMEDRLSLRGSINSTLRVTRSGGNMGRPKDEERCPCGKNALTRAVTRKYDCCRATGKWNTMGDVLDEIKKRSQRRSRKKIAAEVIERVKTERKTNPRKLSPASAQ